VNHVLSGIRDGVAGRITQLRGAAPGWPWEELLEPAGGPGGSAELTEEAVVANLAALAVRPTVADYLALADLVEVCGGYVVARAQHARTRDLEPDETLPIGTAFTLSLTPLVYRPLFAAAEVEVGPELADLCAAVSMRFMLEGMVKGEPDPPLTTVEEFLHCFESQTLPGWRRQLLRYALDPWSPYTGQLLDLADRSGNPHYPDGIGHFLAALRAEIEARERRAIAAEIRRLVERSGYTQRQFAERVGTSAPRLSTYVNGGVTPSASMLLRIRRAAAQARRTAEGA